MIQRVLWLAVLALLSLGLPPGHASELSDREYAERLLGRWWGKEVDEALGRAIIGETVYAADGTVKGAMKIYDRGGDGVIRKTVEVLMIATWEVQDGILITTIVDSLPSDPQFKGLVTRDAILAIDDDKYVLRDLENGRVSERYRTEPGLGI